ncbi:MAG: thermonuclease family protein [Candidatus Hodarchaeota archaeon]
MNIVPICYYRSMGWPKQRIFLFLLGLFLLFPPLFSQANDPQSFTGKVVGISDVDTIKVMREGRAIKVRLHGIDCPEKKQPYGTKTKQFTSDMAFGNEVTVRIKDTDRYVRIVGEVILSDGISLNKELVFVGLALWYRKYAPNDRTLKALESGARAEKKGLWADENPIPPWEWRQGERGRSR